MNKKYEYLLVCGDTHGHLDIVPNYIKKIGLNNCAIIMAGDFGIGFESKRDELRRIKYLSNRLSVSNSTMYVVRGNHDDPLYFLNDEFDTEELKFVSDYSILNLNGHNILCVGGAISVDRIERKPYITGKGTGWWKDEVFRYKHEKAKDIKDIDIVVTHTAPDFCHPFTKGGVDYWIGFDENLKSDLNIERSSVSQLYYTLMENGNNIKQWFYGHFHKSHKMTYKELEFILLNINEIQEIK